jgi:uncharacterized protein YhfF
MNVPPSIHAFWRNFTSSIGHDASDRFYEAFHFDDNEASADELAALVLAGTKRATAGLAAPPLPQAGRRSEELAGACTIPRKK